MTPTGMLVNHFIKKNEAEKLQKEKYDKEYSERIARENEARELQLSAMQNLAKERVDSGTATEFEQQLNNVNLKEIDPDKLKEELERANGNKRLSPEQESFFTDSKLQQTTDTVKELTSDESADNVRLTRQKICRVCCYKRQD